MRQFSSFQLLWVFLGFILVTCEASTSEGMCYLFAFVPWILRDSVALNFLIQLLDSYICSVYDLSYSICTNFG